MPDSTAFLDLPTPSDRTGPRALTNLREYRLSDSRPNIVMLLSDDEGIGEWWGSLRPDMEAFLEGGTIVGQDGNPYTVPGATYFNNYRDVISLCRPSRTSEMSGQLAQNNGIKGNYPHDFSTGINGDHLVWKMLWGEANDRLMQTGQIGKFLGPGWEAGWDTYNPLFFAPAPTDPVQHKCVNYIDELACINGSNIIDSANPGGRPAAKYGWQAQQCSRDAQGNITSLDFFPEAGHAVGYRDPTLPYATDYFIDRMIGMINTFMTRDVSDPRHGLPFYLNVWPTTPHDPYQTPPTDTEHLAAYGTHAIYERPSPHDRATRLAKYNTNLVDGHKWVPPYWDYMRNAQAVDYTDLDGYRPVDFTSSQIQGTGTTGGAWTGGSPGQGSFNGGAWTDGLYVQRNGNQLVQDIDRKGLSVGFDDLLAALVMTLDGWGILGNTVIIVNSDNGWNRGVRNCFFKASDPNGQWTGKDGFGDESLRVPLAISGPGWEPNTICDSYCWNLDIIHTIANIANIYPDWITDNGYPLQDQVADPRAMDDRVMSIGTGQDVAGSAWGHGAATGRLKVGYISNQLVDQWGDGGMHDPDPFEFVDLQDDGDYTDVLSQMDFYRAWGHNCSGVEGVDSCDIFYEP